MRNDNEYITVGEVKAVVKEILQIVSNIRVYDDRVSFNLVNNSVDALDRFVQS